MHWSGEAGKFSETINGIISIPFHSRLFSPSSYVSFLTSTNRSIEAAWCTGGRKKERKKREPVHYFLENSQLSISADSPARATCGILFFCYFFCLPLTSNNFVFILFCTLKPAKKGIKIRLCKLIINNFCCCKIFITASIKLFISLRQKI